MKKILKWIGIGICVLVVVLLVGLTLFGGAMVKAAVNGFGPVLLGVPVSVEKATFRPLSGKIKLTKLHVGNPKDFKTPALFDLDDVEISLNPRSLFSNTIVFHKVTVLAPHITYEVSLLGSNIGALEKQLGGDAKKSDKKVIIEELTVTDAQVNVSITAAGGHAMPVKIGKIEVKDVGKEQGGVTFADAVMIIMGTITGNIENAAKGTGGLVGSGASAVESGAKAVGGVLTNGASSVISGVGNLLGGEKKADEKK
jgi:uncharacterized protein involved in outer membrane biogenesis